MEQKTKPGDMKEHDSFVKEFFSDPPRAQELSRLTIPSDLYEILDFTRLKAGIGEAACL